MKILILGAYESNNLGDAVICECVAHIIKEHFPDASIVIRDLLSRVREKAIKPADLTVMKKNQFKSRIGHMISKYTFFDLVYRQQQNRLNSFLSYLEDLCAPDYDLVVFAGGQMFMDTYALFLNYCVQRFKEKQIPVLFHACGTGPFYSSRIRKILADALSSENVSYISCRDDVASICRLLKDQPKNILDTYDSALSSAKVYDQKKDPDASAIGLGIMYPNTLNTKKVLTFWQNMIRHLDEKNIKWKLFTNGAAGDDAFARKLLSSLPEYKGQESIYLVPRGTEPAELVHTISQFSGLISFRLHSHILAASLDIPTVAIVWDHKLPLFFEKINHPERCFHISDPAEQIIAGLEQSMVSGYDRTLLAEQISRSDLQLTDAIHHAMTKGGIT